MTTTHPTPSQMHQLSNRIFEVYGHDFRDYSDAWMLRRVGDEMAEQQIADFNRYLHQVETQPEMFYALMQKLSINVTEMFRDPKVFRYLRDEVFPVLATYPQIRIWSAGMATGEEPWSLALLLKESGLLERSLIYATDFNPEVVRQATQGTFKLASMPANTRNYISAGGEASLSRYYRTNATHAYLSQDLKDHMVFATHNLATDWVFNEFHLILCRNVMIYFNSQLTSRTLQLFHDSLAPRGFLTLGSSESLRFDPIGRYFETLHTENRVFRKI